MTTYNKRYSHCGRCDNVTECVFITTNCCNLCRSMSDAHVAEFREKRAQEASYVLGKARERRTLAHLIQAHDFHKTNPFAQAAPTTIAEDPRCTQCQDIVYARRSHWCSDCRNLLRSHKK